MRQLIRNLGLSVTILLGLVLVSCSDDDQGSVIVPAPEPTEPPPAAEFEVRAVHASPDAPTVNVLANDVLAFPGISFFQVAPDINGTYVPFPAGDVNIEVTLTDGSPVIDETFSIPANTNQTVVVTGTLSAPGEPLQIIPFTDDVTPTPGQSEIRILHLSPDAPAVDVRLPDGTPLVENLPFGSSSDSLGRIIVPPGTYEVTVFVAGTDTAVLTETLDVFADANFTIYAVGLVGDGSFELQGSIDAL